MRAFTIIIAGATLICTSLSALAQVRAPRPCATGVCLLKRITVLEGEVSDLTKQINAMNAVNAGIIKSGQTISLNSPEGCLAYGAVSGTANGPVWWTNPCDNGNWVIKQTGAASDSLSTARP